MMKKTPGFRGEMLPDGQGIIGSSAIMRECGCQIRCTIPSVVILKHGVAVVTIVPGNPIDENHFLYKDMGEVLRAVRGVPGVGKITIVQSSAKAVVTIVKTGPGDDTGISLMELFEDELGMEVKPEYRYCSCHASGQDCSHIDAPCAS